MKAILEKRILELSAELAIKKTEFDVTQEEIAAANAAGTKAASEYNVIFLKLEEAKHLLAEFVKTEAEGCNAVCEPSAEASSVCEGSEAS